MMMWVRKDAEYVLKNNIKDEQVHVMFSNIAKRFNMKILYFNY